MALDANNSATIICSWVNILPWCSVMADGISSSYFFRINEDTVTDSTRKENLTKCINHSCGMSNVWSVHSYKWNDIVTHDWLLM